MVKPSYLLAANRTPKCVPLWRYRCYCCIIVMSWIGNNAAIWLVHKFKLLFNEWIGHLQIKHFITILQNQWFAQGYACMITHLCVCVTSHYLTWLIHREQQWRSDGSVGVCIILPVFLTKQEHIRYRADFKFAPSQWEMSLQSNGVSHWLGANLE